MIIINKKKKKRYVRL